MNESMILFWSSITTLGSGIIAGIVAFLISRNRNRIEAPGLESAAEKVDAEAIKIRAEFNLDTIKQLSESNKSLLARISENEKRIGELETEHRQALATIEAQGRIMKEQDSRILVLESQIRMLGHEPFRTGTEHKA